MKQDFKCIDCGNLENGECEYCCICTYIYDENAIEHRKPSHWKPIEEGVKPDTVNHPSHYETGRFECFDVMVEALGIEEAKGFCLCNAFKYIYRCKIKHETPTEDIKKAVWYLNKFIELEEVDMRSKEG